MIYRNAEKAAKVVKDQPKMITIMQHLDDPIQKRQIELVKVFQLLLTFTNPNFSAKWKCGRTNLQADLSLLKLIYPHWLRFFRLLQNKEYLEGTEFYEH